MILIVETMDDAAAALVALRDWTREAPELKTGARYGARRRSAEQLEENVVTALRTFRRVRTALDRASDGNPTSSGEASRDVQGSRGVGRRSSAPQRAASTSQGQDSE